MLKYLFGVKDTDNVEAVASILQPILETDIIVEGTVEANLKALEKLKDIGEGALYDEIIGDLKDDYLYSEYLK